MLRLIASLVLVTGCIGVPRSTRRAAWYVNGGVAASGVLMLGATARVNGNGPFIDNHDVLSTGLAALALGLAGMVGIVAVDWIIAVDPVTGSVPP